MADRDISSFLESVLQESEKDKLRQMEDTILYPLLEEVELILNDSIKSFVRAILIRAPHSFWVAPSSDNPLLNPPDEHEEYGNILHIQRFVRCAITLAEAQDYDPIEQDTLIAAALISSVTKFIPIDDTYVIDQMYPYTLDRFVQNVMREEAKNLSDPDLQGVSTTLSTSGEDIDRIMRLVRCHLGRFSAIPETFPKNMIEWTLHFADLLTTKMHFIIDGEDVEESRWSV